MSGTDRIPIRVLSTELSAHVGEHITLAGWVHAKRDLGALSFVVLRDRAGLVQVVLSEPLELLPETVVEVEGQAVAATQARGGVELRKPTFRILSQPVEPPPVELRRPTLMATLPTILDFAPVTPPSAAAGPFRARSGLAARVSRGTRPAWIHRDSTPKIVASATESGANVFGLDYFGKRAYLAQSPQFYKQILVGVFERVYETGAVFRAEPHDTARHLAEYTSLDAELGFIHDHFDVMTVVRAVIAAMVEAIRERATRAVELLEVELPDVPAEIPWVHFSDTGVDDIDLAPADERRLCEERGELVFITGYPMAKRPFYTHPEPARPEYSNSFDLLFRGLEIVTGGQRLHHYEDYVAALADETGPFEGYLQAFKYGMPPHGGFALGLERWIARLVGASNIRETTLFPRDLNRLAP